MVNKIKINKMFVSCFLILAFLGQCGVAQAERWERRGRERFHHDHFYVRYPYPVYGRTIISLPIGFVSLVIGGSRYYYCDGIYYRRYLNSYVIIPTPIGAVVTTLPLDCRTVLVGGATYYTSGGVYYRYSPYGYEVVSEPRVIVSQPLVSQGLATAALPPERILSQEKVGISDIIVLSRAGVNDDVIIEKIIASGAVFKLSLEEVEALRKEGVSSRVVNFMLDNRR